MNNPAHVKDVGSEQDLIELGRQNGMTVIDRRSKKGEEAPVVASVPRNQRTGDMHDFPAWCRENRLDPAQIIAEKAREVEGAAYNGNTEPLRNLAIWAMKRGLETTIVVSDERAGELEAIAIRMAKRIRELEKLVTGIEGAKIEAQTMNNPAPIRAVLEKFQVTEEEKKSKKIRVILFNAEKALDGFPIQCESN